MEAFFLVCYLFGGAFKIILGFRDFGSAWNNMNDGEFDGIDSVCDGKEGLGEKRLPALLSQKPRSVQAELYHTIGARYQSI